MIFGIFKDFRKTRISSCKCVVITFLLYTLGGVSASSGADLPDISVEPKIISHAENVNSTAKTYTITIPSGDYSNEHVIIQGEISGGRLWSEHNGDRSCYQGIINHIIKPGMSDREQAIAAWRFMDRESLAHGRPRDFFLYANNPECQGVVEGMLSIWRMLGHDYRHYGTGTISMPTGGNHYTAELFYDGKYHLFDANQNVMFPTPWGEYAGFEDLVADDTLYSWQEKGGYYYYRPLSPDPDFDYTPVTNKTFGDAPDHTIEMRPGESLFRRWWTDSEPRWGNNDFVPKTVFSRTPGMFPGDGVTVMDFKVEPDFANPPNNVALTNVKVTGSGDSAIISPQDPNQPATIEVTLSNPFLESLDSDYQSWDGVKLLESWISGVFESTGSSGGIRVYARDYAKTPESTYTDLGTISLTSNFQEKAKIQSSTRVRENNASKLYLNNIPQFRIVMTGPVQMKNLEFVAQGQFNSRALPELRAGTNNIIHFTADSVGQGGVLVTHRWRKNTLKFSENPVQLGHTLTLTTEVSNDGGTEATNVAVDFRVGEPDRTNMNMWTLKSIGTVIIPSIAPGETKTAILNWEPDGDNQYLGRPGNHFVEVVVDPQHTIQEISKTNNKTGKVLTILRTPNILTLPDYISYGNGMLWSWVTYASAGLATDQMEVYNVEVEFRDGDSTGPILGTQIIPVMTVAEAVLVAIPVSQKPQGNVTVIVDPKDKISPEWGASIYTYDNSDNIVTAIPKNQAPPSWVTGVPPDTTPPTLPQNIIAIAQSESTINLTWEGSDDPESGISNYKIYRDDINVGQSTSTFFLDTGLSEGTTYTYEVTAVNGTGLESAKSVPVSATTTLSDTTLPTVISVNASDSTHVAVVFSEPVEQASSTNISNYSINNGITVSSALLGSDLKTVTLATSSHTGSVTYTLTVNNIKDRAGSPNIIAVDTQMTYTSSNSSGSDFITGQLRSYSTIRSIGLEWDITGDNNRNAVATVQHREQGASTWKQAMPLFRVDHEGFNMLAGSILFLNPGTTYEVQIDLTDPDGGYENQSITIVTRPIPTLPTGGRTFYVVPGSGGGDGSQNNPFKGISVAQSVAQPGDVFLLAAGNYGGRVIFNKPGNIGRYIVWKTTGNGTVTFNGVDVNASHIWLEGINIEKGPSDTTGIKTSNSPEDVVISRNNFNNCHYSIWLSGGGKDWYITDNVIVGDVLPSSGDLGGEGIELNKTSGHVVAYNSISNVADGISYPRTNVDIYGNDIFDTSDDGIEPDYGYANNRLWGNRISNALNNGISFQPMNSAPWYIIRNQVIAGYNALKLRSSDDRVLLAHNTFVGWSRVQTINVEQLLGMHSTNNLWISATGDYLWENGNGGSPDWRTNLDYDGFNDLNGGGNKFKWGTNQYSSLAAFKAGTGLVPNGVSVDKDTCFETFNVNQPPASSPPQYMSLNAGSNAVDAGVVLPNINDDFSGSAPDLGAYEYGKPLPQYGPRIEIPQDETPPSIPPTLVSASINSNPTEVIIVFSEPVEFSSATNTSNYSINNGIMVSSASLGSDLKTVTLATSQHTGNVSYTLTVNNIKDRASIPNMIASNTQVAYTFLAQLIISNLTVVSDKTYEIVQNGLQNGMLVYIDRTYTYSSVPALVASAMYIKTANDDKNANEASFITFDVNQDVTVNVAYDDRISTKPSWLTSFTDTGDNLVTTDTTLSIFAKDYAASTITLGGNEAGYSMFTVIIIGQGTGSPSDTTPPLPPQEFWITGQ